MKEYIVLDIETKKLAEEVEGSWSNIKAFGLAVAVVKIYHEGR